MIGTEDGYWYSFKEKDGIYHYEFYKDSVLQEQGTATLESFDGRWDNFLRGAREALNGRSS